MPIYKYNVNGKQVNVIHSVEECDFDKMKPETKAKISWEENGEVKYGERVIGNIKLHDFNKYGSSDYATSESITKIEDVD